MQILGQLVKKPGFKNRLRWKLMNILPTNGITFAVYTYNVKFYYHRIFLFSNSDPHKCISNPTINYTGFFKLQNPKSSNIRIASLPVVFQLPHTVEHWPSISMLISTPAPIILPVPRTSLTGNSESENTYFYSFRREHSLQQF
jgi:hypothetical protein